MRLIIHRSENATIAACEVVPAQVYMGAMQDDKHLPLNACIAAVYKKDDMPVILALCRALKKRKQVPELAIYDRDVQIVYRLTPVPADIQGVLRPALQEHGVTPTSFLVSSAADAFPEDDTAKLFERTFKNGGFVRFFVYQDPVRIGENGFLAGPSYEAVIRTVIRQPIVLS